MTTTAARCPSGHANTPDSRYCCTCGTAIYPGAPPTWATAADAWRVITHPPHLRTALVTAFVIGTLLFAINQLDVVLAGDADLGVAVKAALTYVVPFCVANIGILAATRQRDKR